MTKSLSTPIAHPWLIFLPFTLQSVLVMETLQYHMVPYPKIGGGTIPYHCYVFKQTKIVNFLNSFSRLINKVAQLAITTGYFNSRWLQPSATTQYHTFLESNKQTCCYKVCGRRAGAPFTATLCGSNTGCSMMHCNLVAVMLVACLSATTKILCKPILIKQNKYVLVPYHTLSGNVKVMIMIMNLLVMIMIIMKKIYDKNMYYCRKIGVRRLP